MRFPIRTWYCDTPALGLDLNNNNNFSLVMNNMCYNVVCYIS